MTKDELIAALERAKIPNRWLDAEIAAFIHPNQPCEVNEDGTIWIGGVGSENSRTLISRSYTASLDAALSLREPDSYLAIRIPSVSGVDPDDGLCAVFIEFPREPFTVCGRHKEVAIAVIIAALKARP